MMFETEVKFEIEAKFIIFGFFSDYLGNIALISETNIPGLSPQQKIISLSDKVFKSSFEKSLLHD